MIPWCFHARYATIRFSLLNNILLLDNQAIKLSDDLNLNEIECIRLLCLANQEVICFVFALLSHSYVLCGMLVPHS